MSVFNSEIFTNLPVTDGYTKPLANIEIKSMKLTEFETMWSIYPSEYAVMEMAFSKRNSPKTNENTRKWANDNIHNSCCVRLSYCLNHTNNHKISLEDVRKAGLASNKYITGKSGKYIFNVPSISKYLNAIYTRTTKWEWTDEKTRNNFKNEIINKKGIIIFHEVGNGLNGHVDLWKNGIVKTYDLFNTATSIEFWESN